MMGRIRLSLNRDWKFHLGQCSPKEDLSHGAVYNGVKAGACAGVPQSDFDVSGWETVQIPHDWSIRQPFSEKNVADWAYKPRGKAWYRKSFLLPEEYQEKTLKIGFEGVATHCTVYFNGSVVARNYCGYTPFEIDITDMALFGKVPNVLAVLVDADCWEGWWYEGAGIYRDVWLEVCHPVHIEKDSVFLSPKESAVHSSKWLVDTSMEICNETSADMAVTLDISLFPVDRTASGSVKRAKMEKTISKGAHITNQKEVYVPIGRANVSFLFEVFSPLLWDIENPNLYEAVIHMRAEGEILDTIKTVCGFRTIEITSENGFFLNHRPLKLFGTCNHQDFGGLGVAVNDNLWEYRIEQLKKMGSNAYRCAHGMTADALLDACDRMGMLVMAENRNYDSSDEGLRQLEILIKRCRNHPSVMMYSIFNEEPLQGTKQGERMARRMCSLIHEMDAGRMTTGAMNSGLLTTDNASLEVDVCGVNYQIENYDVFHEKHPDIPIVATETTSTFATRGCYKTNPSKNEIACYDEDASDWGNTVRETWQAIMEREFISGGFMWTGFDYLGEPTPHVWPSVSSFFGMLDTCGFPKDGYYLARAIFSKEPVCHVLPHWTHRGKEGQKIRVMSHTNCEEAELFINGKSCGRKKIALFQQAFWEVAYEQGTLRLVGYNQGRKEAEDSYMTAGETAGLCLVPWKGQISGNGRDAVPVAVIAVDDRGNEVPDAEFAVTFQVKNGSLLGACNGNPNCHEAFDSPVRSLFHGRGMAVVMPDEDVLQMEVKAVGKTAEEKTVEASVFIEVKPEQKAASIPSVSEQFLTDWKITAIPFEERPDPMVKIEDFDMNSWQSIRVDQESGSPQFMENQQGKYVIYQTVTNVPDTINGHLPELFFHGIWGECEIYLNGKKRSECTYEWPVQHRVSLTEEDIGAMEIRILVRSNNINTGLHSLIVLR